MTWAEGMSASRLLVKHVQAGHNISCQQDDRAATSAMILQHRNGDVCLNSSRTEGAQWK